MSPLLLIGSVLLFAGIVVIVVGGVTFSEELRLLSRRLTVSQAAAVQSQVPELRVTLEDGLLKRFDRIVTPKDEEERESIRRWLVRAGFRKASAMRIYYVCKAVFALGFALIAAIVAPLIAQRLPYPIVAAVLVLPLLGYFLPSIWVELNVERRSEAAELGFPDTLDMLLVCIEAGQGIDQACRRVAQEIGTTSPVLAEELQVVNNELQAGKQRASVFHDFAERTGVADIKAFTTVLKQSDEYGVSIAETLRVYASEMRHKRVMRAEEKANLMPVKVAMGSIFFTVPPTMIIMAGPSLIMLLRAFGMQH